MTTISLVLATYQANLTMLHQALENSDLFDEVILHVNDNLTASLVKLPKNCKLIYREERCSVQKAFNDAIGVASSTYILPFTDDDFFHREALTNLIDYLKYSNDQKDIIHYPIYVGYNDNWKIWGINSVTFDSVKETNIIPFSCIYHKDIWTQIKGYKEIPYCDWFFWLEVLKQNYKFEYWNYPIYCHRQGHKETLANKDLKEYGIEKIKLLFNNKLL